MHLFILEPWKFAALGNVNEPGVHCVGVISSSEFICTFLWTFSEAFRLSILESTLKIVKVVNEGSIMLCFFGGRDGVGHWRKQSVFSGERQTSR